MTLYFAFLFILGLVDSGLTYEKCRWQLTNMTLADTDVDWFKKAAEKGFYVVEHGDCNNCEGAEAWSWLKAPSGRTVKNRICFHMDIVTKYGPYSIPLTCEFNDIESQECDIDFTGTDLADKLRWQGTLKFISTDNLSYVAGSTCLLGKENFYWIITTDPDRKIKPEVYDKIMKLFHEYGFKQDNRAIQGKSPFYFDKMASYKC